MEPVISVQLLTEVVWIKLTSDYDWNRSAKSVQKSHWLSVLFVLLVEISVSKSRLWDGTY